MTKTMVHLLIVGGLIGMLLCRIMIYRLEKKRQAIHRAELEATYERIRQIEARTAATIAETERIRAGFVR